MDETSRRQRLTFIAVQTLSALPDILESLDTTNLSFSSQKYSRGKLSRLDPNICPSFPEPAVIRVANEDTLNVAIQLAAAIQSNDGDQQLGNPKPLVINFASPTSPGGGWLTGRLAQEEALCYRSSLAQSLDPLHYPLAWDDLIYSKYVLIIREDMRSGHELYKTAPETFPVVSCVTVAALRQPKVHTITLKPDQGAPGGLGPGPREKLVYANDKDRSLTKAKMRLALRAAAVNGHHSLVLGALGCGVYGNPPEDVAYCWLEVLREDEFAGNWWREVVFAVYDLNNEGNYSIFDRVLSGEKV